MDTERLSYLLERFRLDALTPEEQEELWHATAGQQDSFVLEAMKALAAQAALEPVSEERAFTDASFARIVAIDKRPKVVTASWGRSKKMAWIRWAAAVVILLLGVTVYLVRFKKPAGQAVIVQHAAPADIQAPSSNRATITLADGKKILLDSVRSGVLAMENGIHIQKLADGQIAYNGQAEVLAYNTLSNPRGSRPVEMALSDGSRVWLNAGSSITYPVAFMGKERKVTIAGEAYFEVKEDPSKPFYVLFSSPEGTAREEAIRVLGTHFNAKAYSDEQEIKVTLLEGAVKVSNHVQAATIRPGQQAKLSANASIAISDANVEAVMAWKNGIFNFNQQPLQEVMKQLSRWYDVEIEYRGAVPPRTFGGEIGRELSLSEVLAGLSDIGVHYKIEGKKLIVLP